MDQTIILWPLLAQVALTIFMYVRLAAVKLKEIKAGNVDREQIAINQDLWPAPVRLVNNNLRNQFETPILFYLLCVVLWGLNRVDMPAMIIACLYVAARAAHAYVHTTSNVVLLRMRLFMLSFLFITGLLGLTVRALLSV